MSGEISRRDFLKVTGVMATVAAGAQLPRTRWLDQAKEAHVAAEGEETVFRSVCRMCHGTCGTLVHVRNGRVVKVEGNPDYPTNQGTMCVRGLSTIQHQYNPRRLRYPMKRVGNRGEGQWQRITWDEAYQILADKLTETWDKYGKQAVALCGGTGRHWQDWYGIFQNAMGIGIRFGMPPLCYLPRIEVITRMIGYRIPVADYFGWKGDKPKLVVHWGNNLTYCHADGMHGSRPLAMANAGAKTIVIDPVYTNLAEKADVWLPVKPATDTALALSFLNVIVNENLYDHEFVEKWSNLPGLVRDDNGQMLTEYDLSGQERPVFHGPPFAVLPPEKIVVWDADKNQAALADGPAINPAMTGSFQVKLGDGTTVTCHTAWDLLVQRLQEYTPDKVSQTTWVPAEKIQEAARLIAGTKGWALQWGVSFDQWGVNSSRAVQAAMLLVTMTGNLDIPGGMAMWSPPNFRMAGFPGEIGPYVAPEMFRADLLPPEVSDLAAQYNPFPFERGHSDFVNRAVAADELKFEMLWVVGANPLLNSMNTNQVFQAIQKFPFIVTWDLYMTPTAMLSDLVLPVSMWTERENIVDCHLVWGIAARPRCTEPVGEARSDEEGTLGLVKVLAQKDPAYWNEVIPWNTYQEWLDWRLEPMGITFEQLGQELVHVFPQEPYSYKKTGFLLPAGRAELFLRAAQAAGQDPLPFYTTPPLFNLEGDLAKEYPLLCTTRRVPTYFHTEYRMVPWLRETFPEPLVEINPRTAQTLGIQNGDWVYIESSKGKIKQKAVVTEIVHPQVVCSNHDFWFPEAPQTLPELGGVFESNHNLLTYNDPSQGYDPLNGTPQLRGFLVKVYKANDGPPKGLDPQKVMTWTPVEEV
jgi:anaerobic selenocysteine-containing dehydrogenase